MIKKLIEVALPLEKINEVSVREKSIRHGHPITLHLWWARRPLATARAVIWASLVDDPSSHPEQFPTEAEQSEERQRLFKILEELVVWENSTNEKFLEVARAEIMKSTGGNPPALLDPFAGGGTIPLEAQRLGLEAHAHDLNPVAVMINKALIEIPPMFKDRPPVNPEARQALVNDSWTGAAGLAADIAYYGKMLKEEAFRQIGHLYPTVQLPEEQGGGEATVIAWIWARTVRCPNPACGCTAPLIKSFDLSVKKGHETHLEVRFEQGEPVFTVAKGKSSIEGSVKRSGAVCLNCSAPIDFPYIRAAGKRGELHRCLATVVAKGIGGRLYLTPDECQCKASQVERPDSVPTAQLPKNPQEFNTPAYGMDNYATLFTNRQMVALTSLGSLLKGVQDRIVADATSAWGRIDQLGLQQGGKGAQAYSEAIGVYLSLVIDKLTDYHSTICTWHTSGEKITHTFARQAIPMTWDYAEANPFSKSSGCFDNALKWVVKSVENLPAQGHGVVQQYDAQSDCGLRDIIIVSTDPPYYDNISYADLSDYFYVWLRQNLQNTYPNLFGTMLVPKAEELVATPYRFEGGKEAAKDFFEGGMLNACAQMYAYSGTDYPVTIYYAYKQSQTTTERKTASTGWETMLSAVINAGFAITGTWPVRTELANRTIGQDSNALASSIVLVCRKRPQDAPQTTKKNFVSTLRRELYPALQKLQQSNLAPVDLAQSAIGPGMAVFSRYKRVLEANGTPMTVRTALQIINAEIDLFFNEQAGNLDADSRFCVELYTQCTYNDIKYGEAEVLANAKGASIPALSALGLVRAQSGTVCLLGRSELPKVGDVAPANVWFLTQLLTRALEKGGIDACAKVVLKAEISQAERARELAYRLYTIAERKKWKDEAFAFNNLVVAWRDIQAKVADSRHAMEQVELL